jgi:hypothetical protein
MTDTKTADVPVPENWSEIDSHDTFFLYLKLVREELLAGKELPEMFRPSERVEE